MPELTLRRFVMAKTGNCLWCGKEFIVPGNNPGRKYCDMNCYKLDIKKNGKPWLHKREEGEAKFTIVKCQHCDKEYKIEKWRYRRGYGKFCSRSCSSKHNMSILNRTRSPWNKGKKGPRQKVSKDYNLQIINPELSKQFFVERNGISPEHVSPKSNKKYWWKCDRGEDHIWLVSPSSRNRSPGCPFCLHKKPSKDHNLAAVYPKLAAQWHYEKNGDLKPEEVMPKTERAVWWKCNAADDHEWEAKIHSRAVKYNDDGFLCPFCQGRKVCKSNSLATTNPELLAQWDYTKNKVSPYEIYYGVHRKFWWNCHKGHAWLARPNSRLSDFKKCPVCSMPRGEAKISKLLDSYGVKYQREYTHPELKRRRFDFAIFLDELRLIEYHGLQHYEPVDFCGARKDPEKDFRGIQKRDKEKRDFVKEKKILFLEIPYFKFDEIETKVKTFVGKS